MPAPPLRFLLFFPLVVGCVPVSQQTISEPGVDCTPLTVSKEQFDETIVILRDKISEYEARNDWKGPCRENPLFLQRFQSHYKFNEQTGFRIQNRCLLFSISGGGAADDCLRQTLLIWNGEFTRDKKGRLVTRLVIAFKNMDIRRAIFHDASAFDLSSIKVETPEDIYFDIEGFSQLLRYEPRH